MRKKNNRPYSSRNYKNNSQEKNKDNSKNKRPQTGNKIYSNKNQYQFEENSNKNKNKSGKDKEINRPKTGRIGLNITNQIK